VKGTLPPPDTVCSVVGTPFPNSDASHDLEDREQSFLGKEKDEEETAALSADEMVVLDAVRKLSASYTLPMLL
jgi:hypothetical protein